MMKLRETRQPLSPIPGIHFLRKKVSRLQAPVGHQDLWNRPKIGMIGLWDFKIRNITHSILKLKDEFYMSKSEPGK